jgi:hypothetical protein
LRYEPMLPGVWLMPVSMVVAAAARSARCHTQSFPVCGCAKHRQLCFFLPLFFLPWAMCVCVEPSHHRDNTPKKDTGTTDGDPRLHPSGRPPKGHSAGSPPPLATPSRGTSTTVRSFVRFFLLVSFTHERCVRWMMVLGWDSRFRPSRRPLGRSVGGCWRHRSVAGDRFGWYPPGAEPRGYPLPPRSRGIRW